MSKDAIFKAGMAAGQAGKPMPTFRGVPNAPAQTFRGGYSHGKK